VEGSIGEATEEYVELHAAGTHAKGQYRCAGCGYGITIHDELPDCPMCAGAVWELTPWTPFGNAGQHGQVHGATL